MPPHLTNGFKIALLCFPLLFLTPETLSQPSFCETENVKTEDSLLKQFKEKFNAEIKAHYDSLTISESEKARHLKQYESLEITVCPNPHNTSQKIIYIEYEKDWWGSLYFTLVGEGKILKWAKIETYGTITKRVKWNDEKSFFYEDSTHMGTRTHNTCLIQDFSPKCEKPKVQQ